MIPSCIIDFDFVDRLGQLLLRVHHRNHDRQIVRERKPPALVGVALGPVPENAAVHRGARNVHQAQTLEDGFIQRLTLPLVRLAHIDAHQPGRASHFRMRPLRRRWAFLAGHFDDVGILDLDHAVGDHVVQGGHELIDFRGGSR